MRAFIRHITLQTNHVRDSLAGEVSAEALATCQTLIKKCLANDAARIAIPGFNQFYLTCGQVGGRTLLGSVWHGLTDPVPLINFAVATRSRNSAIAWREMHAHATIRPFTDSGNVPPVPWIAVSIEPDLIFYPDAAEWLGDFERCLAWAWLGYRKQRIININPQPVRW